MTGSKCLFRSTESRLDGVMDGTGSVFLFDCFDGSENGSGHVIFCFSGGSHEGEER